MGLRYALLPLAAVAAMGLATPAHAQDVNAPCRLCGSGQSSGEDQAREPIRLGVDATLDFGKIVVLGNAGGSAELRPDGGSIVSGTVSPLSMRAMVGQAEIRGEPGRLVRVDLPTSIELVGLSGGTIRLESISSDLPAIPRLDSTGKLTFRFGGMLKIAGELDGEFRGEVRIDVDYF